MFEDLIPELQDPARELLLAAGQAGLQPRITSTVRTHTQQARLFRKWQAGLSPFPAAPPGTSAHEFGFAFDMVVTPMEALADVGYTWETWGGVWGSQRDPVHFQYPGFVAPSDSSYVEEFLKGLWSTTGAQFPKAADIYFGKSWASLLRMFPGMSKNLALQLLSEPFETFQDWYNKNRG
jgi:hypothetical protein